MIRPNDACSAKCRRMCSAFSLRLVINLLIVISYRIDSALVEMRNQASQYSAFSLSNYSSTTSNGECQSIKALSGRALGEIVSRLVIR